MGDVLDKRLVFVTGKGGVGKSTVAAALGLIAARRGRRAIVAEVAGQDQVRRALGGEEQGDHHSEREVVPGLHSISIDPEHALAEYLRDQLPMRAVAEMLGSSRMFQYFAAATPGLRELLTVGKIWDLVQPRRRTGHGGGYDVAIVDAPATGHALGFLRAPRTFAEIARVGPIARQAGIIDGLLRDGAQTGVVAVAVPAEMPVNEAVLLREELERDGPPLNRVIANGVYPRRFGPRDARKLEQALADAPSPLARTALRAALSAATRIRVQEAQLARLAEETETRPVELPFLFEPHWTPAAVGRLSEILEREL